MNRCRGCHADAYINGRERHVSNRSDEALLSPQRFQVLAMRKTKLIILPTKCLNQMGFLLLFLSCPVIGDWGRIRPDSEMSQWSILIDREGSCGLVRDSPGIEKAKTPDGPMECYAADAELRNNTQSLIEPETDFITHHESRIERRNVRSSRVDAERRVSNARRSLQERSFRRSVQGRSERRAVSLDRQTGFRSDERRMEREVRRSERDSRERREYRRMTRSLDESRTSLERRVRESSERMHDTARRLSLSRQERRNEPETARRRIQQSRLSQSRNDRRVEERRLARRVLTEERHDGRREAERRNSPERRMDRREQREERRIAQRRSSEEVTGRRVEERTEATSHRIRASNTREARRVRDTTEISRRREIARSAVRNERRIVPEIRRIESDPSRKADARVSVRRGDAPEDRREYIPARIRDHREKSARVDYTARYDKLEPLTAKNGRWEFLDGLKTWFGQKGDHENWISSHGDFATTCLVGAAVYFLTTRQVKTV